MQPIAHVILLLTLAATAHADGKAADDSAAVAAEKQAAREEFSTKLLQLKVTRLYRVDPDPRRTDAHAQAERFYNRVVIGSAAPSDASSAETITRSMRAIVAAPDDGANACFTPRHGLTLTDGTSTYHVLMCFECLNYVVFTSDGTDVYRDSFTAEHEYKQWEQAFHAAGLTSPKRK